MDFFKQNKILSCFQILAYNILRWRCYPPYAGLSTKCLGWDEKPNLTQSGSSIVEYSVPPKVYYQRWTLLNCSDAVNARKRCWLEALNKAGSRFLDFMSMSTYSHSSACQEFFSQTNGEEYTQSSDLHVMVSDRRRPILCIPQIPQNIQHLNISNSRQKKMFISHLDSRVESVNYNLETIDTKLKGNGTLQLNNVK